MVKFKLYDGLSIGFYVTSIVFQLYWDAWLIIEVDKAVPKGINIMHMGTATDLPIVIQENSSHENQNSGSDRESMTTNSLVVMHKTVKPGVLSLVSHQSKMSFR